MPGGQVKLGENFSTGRTGEVPVQGRSIIRSGLNYSPSGNPVYDAANCKLAAMQHVMQSCATALQLHRKGAVIRATCEVYCSESFLQESYCGAYARKHTSHVAP